MRISILTDGIFPYVIGGMQKHSYYLVKYLAQQEVNVDLYHTLTQNPDSTKLELFTEAEKKFIRSFTVPFPGAGRLPGHYLKASYRYSSEVYKLLKQQAPADFIYAKGFSAWKLLEEKDKGVRHPPVGINFHGYEMFQRQPDLKTALASRFLLRKPVLYNTRNAQFVFSYGGKITEIIESLGIVRRRIIEIPTGIEASWLENPEQISQHDRIRFVFVGRFERRKGIEELNSALEQLKGNKRFEFHFIGPIPGHKKLRSENVFYHGAITSAGEMRQAIREMDVLVCPSHSEGMPNVILEAMASGLAVIATDVGAVQLMVDEKNGVLLPESTPLLIREAMEKLMAVPPGELAALKRSSIEKVKSNFLWENIGKETVKKIAACIS